MAPVTPSESSIEQRIVKLIERRGGYQVKGDCDSTKGTSDRLCCYRGRFLAIEVKQPGKGATQIQQHRLDQVNAAGGYGFVAHSVGTVEQMLDLIDATPMR